MRNSLTQIKTQKRGVSYKTVSSPETNQLQKQVDNIYYQNNQLMVEAGGETFPAVPQENLLPQVSAADVGNVASVDENGDWVSSPLTDLIQGSEDIVVDTPESGRGMEIRLDQTVKNRLLPNVTTADNGKVLGVENGSYALQEPSGGTTVVANPTLSGSEAELTGLEVAGTKYKVPSGGGIVAVDSLPTPSQTEYEKHLLYLQGGELNFIAEKLAEEPTVDVVAALPSARDDTSACAIGTDAYIFGGGFFSDIVKFDSVAQTVTTLSVTLPSGMYYTSACAIGTDAYIVGDSDFPNIVKFDSVSQTVTKLSVTLPSSMSSASACAIGTNAYIFGDKDFPDIVKFDSVAQTVTTLSVSLPSGRNSTSAVSIDTNAYIFGGYARSNLSDIVKFDSVTQTVTTLTATLPSGRSNTSACAIGTNAYVFGGYNGNDLSDIVKFDSVTQTVTKLSATLPSGRRLTSACAIGTNAYVFGGTETISLSDIVQVAFGTAYGYKQITSKEI